MVAIRQMLVDSSKYSIKCPYSMTPKWIVIHNTANDASANNEVSYMRNNNYEVSFHYAVDDIEVVQGLPLDRNGWHAGDGNGEGNRLGIGIEICYSKSGGSRFDKAEINASQLVAKLLKDYGWGIDKVRTHQSFSGKYCPHRTMDKGWQRFLNMVQAELNKLNGSSPSNPQPSGELYRVRKSWADASSQLGAYSVLQNAKDACKGGYSVYDSKGNVVYTNGGSQPTPPIQPSKEKINIFYKTANVNSGYYSLVQDTQDYAGDLKNACARLIAYPNKGEVKFQVSPLNETRFYPEVQNYFSANSIYDEAGVSSVGFDKFRIRFSLNGYKIRYCAYAGGRWWDWCESINNQYGDWAGKGDGTPITGIQMEIVAL